MSPFWTGFLTGAGATALVFAVGIVALIFFVTVREAK